MMFLAGVNYLAVLVATLAAMVVGSLWYSPLLFGKMWMKLMGWNESKMKGSKGAGPAMFGMLVFALITACVLAHFIVALGATTAMAGLVVMLWVWFGFMVPVMATNSLFEGRSWKLFFLSAFHYLVSLAIQSVILALWR